MHRGIQNCFDMFYYDKSAPRYLYVSKNIQNSGFVKPELTDFVQYNGKIYLNRNMRNQTKLIFHLHFFLYCQSRTS